MKKTLLILCALMLITLGASAQVDYSYLINTGTWARDAGNTSTASYNSVAYERYGEEISVTGTDPVKVIYQTIENLPAGTYDVTFYAVANNAWVGAAYGDNIAQVFANTTVEDVEVYDQTGVADLSVYEHTLTCTVTDGTLEYGLQNVATGGNWYVCQGISLYSTSETPTQLSLSEGDVVEDEGDPTEDKFHHWIISGPSSGEFALNTWSTEGETSGMVTPFIQYWIGSGSVLGAATLRHYQLGGLPAGYYRVAIDARAFDENSTNEIAEGKILIHANEASIDLTTGMHNLFNNVSAEVYGTYELITEVTEQVGTLDISLTVAEESACDWLSWKNLKVVYIGEEIPYTIGEPECAANGTYVQPGSEVSITFSDCLSPTTDETPMIAEGKSITVNNNDVEATVTSAGLTATVTFTIPETIEQGTTVTVTVPEGLLTWENATAVSSPTRETTYTFTTPSMADQMGVYLLSVYEDEFLSRGHDYGTAADVDHYGIPVNIVATEDGSYTIMFIDSYGYMYGDAWAWVDAAEAGASNYTINPVTLTDGSTVYQFLGGTGSGDSPMYVYDVEKANNATDTQDTYRIANNGIQGENYSEDEQTYWQILTMDERNEHKEAFVQSQKDDIAELVDAADLDSYITSQTANDVTYLVADANFNAAVSPNATASSTGWIGSYGYTNDTNTNYGTLNTGSGTGSEVYGGFMQLQQTITGLNSGVYKIDLNGLYRQGGDAICYNLQDYDLSIACIDANGYEINLKPWASEATNTDGYSPDNKSQAYTACVSGYANELYTYVDTDGELVITISSPGYIGQEWMYVRQIYLTYYGDVEEEVADDCDYTEGDEVEVDGTTYSVVGENLVANGGFNNGVTDWTAGDGTNNYETAADIHNFGYATSGGYNGGAYVIDPTGGGYTSTASLTQAITVEEGKTYLFVGYTNGTSPTSSNLRYNGLMQMSDETSEVLENGATTGHDAVVEVQLEWGDGDDDFNGWTKTEGVFTAETGYVGVRFSWCSGANFDGIQLYEVEEVPELEYDYDVTWALANPSFEVDNVAYLEEDATRSTASSGDYTGGAYTIANGLTGWTLVAPTNTDASRPVADLMTAACQRTDDDYGAPGTPSNEDQMLYLRNSWTTGTASVTQVLTLPEGSYKLTVDSKCVTSNTDASPYAALVVGDDASLKLPTHTAYNGDDLAWDTSSLTFEVTEDTEEVTIGVNVSFDGHPGLSVALDNFKLYTAIDEDEYEDKFTETIKWDMTEAMWGTLILPFDAKLGDGLTAYSCDDTEDATDEDGNTITDEDGTPVIEVALTEVGQSIKANTPYVIKCTDESAIKTHTFSGVPSPAEDGTYKETYTEGLLTGTLVDLAVEKGAAFTLDGTEYLLQNHTGEGYTEDSEEGYGIGFYPIWEDSSEEATLEAYHCYLTYTTSGSQNPVRAFISLPGDAGEETGIVAVEGDAIANDAIYDLAGRRVSKAVKGVYIMNGKKVLVK